MVLAILGAAVLMGESLAFNLANLFGDALGVVTAMFFGAYILTVGRLRARVPTAVIMVWSSLVTALVLLPATLLWGEGLIATTAWGWTVLVGLALIAHAGGQQDQIEPCQHRDPAEPGEHHQPVPPQNGNEYVSHDTCLDATPARGRQRVLSISAARLVTAVHP